MPSPQYNTLVSTIPECFRPEITNVLLSIIEHEYCPCVAGHRSGVQFVIVCPSVISALFVSLMHTPLELCECLSR